MSVFMGSDWSDDECILSNRWELSGVKLSILGTDDFVWSNKECYHYHKSEIYTGLCYLITSMNCCL